MKKIVNLSLLLTLVVGLSSCLKDKSIIGPEAPAAIPNIIEFKNPAPPTSGTSDKTAFYAMSFDIEPSATFDLTVSYSGANPAPNDLVVHVALDDAAITAANAEQDMQMIPLPADMFSTSSLDVTIPKGERTGTITVTLDPTKFDLTQPYGLGFKIKSVSGTDAPISGNYGTVVIGIGAKNKYDGVYELKGYHNRVPYNYPYDTEVELVTVGPNSVRVFWPAAGTFGHPIGVGPNNSLSWYGGAISPVIVFDPATNAVTDVYNAGGSTTITLFTGPGSRESKYNPSDKSIVVDWNYANNPLRAFFDNLTYIGPRK